MKIFLVFVTVIIHILTSVSFSEASCGSSNCSLINGSQEGTVNKGKFVMDVSYRYISQDKKKSGSNTISSEVLVSKVDFEMRKLELDHHREFRTINKLVQLDASFGLTDIITLSVSVPAFNDRYHEHDDGVTPADSAGEFTNTDGSTGFGDVTVIGKVAPLKTPKHHGALGFGVKFPTGEYQLRNSEGDINEPTIMPGTGSYDFILSGFYNFSFMPNFLDIFVSISHRFTTENSLDYLFGDSTFLDGGASIRLTDIALLSLQINARISRRDRFINMDVPSTGGEFVNITPGVRLIATENLSFYSHVQAPIYQRVNEVNLVPNFGVLFGVSYAFPGLS
jgi:hypothetical protein